MATAQQEKNEDFIPCAKILAQQKQRNEQKEQRRKLGQRRTNKKREMGDSPRKATPSMEEEETMKGGWREKPREKGSL
uniref:Uncharacterized protein n=1 Tax=Nelumbo nucifera TaxID=4432 RepID=A0A822YA38_NELNU|nr:TPA_asm: hypothetical protein HUJ06_027916 [Nelumbo nucifera]